MKKFEMVAVRIGHDKKIVWTQETDEFVDVLDWAFYFTKNMPKRYRILSCREVIE